METTTPAPTPPPAPAGEDKTVAIVAYLTLIGFLVAIIIHSNKKTKLGAFHLRQMLGFMLTCIVIGFSEIVLIFIPILGWLAIFVLWVSMLVLGHGTDRRNQRRDETHAGVRTHVSEMVRHHL